MEKTQLKSYISLMFVVCFTFVIALFTAGCDHAHSSSNLELVQENAATCSKDGNIAYYKCKDCNKLFKDENGENEITAEDVVVKAHHTLDYHKAKRATCVEDGNIEYWQCIECNKNFTNSSATVEVAAGDIITSATGKHDLTQVLEKPATCTTTGVKQHWECENCGKIFEKNGGGYTETTSNDLVINAKGHAFGDLIQKAATCTEEGTMEHYHCKQCGMDYDKTKTIILNSTAIKKLPHTYGSEIAEVKATCVKAGTKAHYECEKCEANGVKGEGSDVITEVLADELIIPIDSTAHAYNKVDATTSTCAAHGIKEHYTCNNEGCDKLFVKTVEDEKDVYTEKNKSDLELELAAHSWRANPVEKQDATCTEDGHEAYFECSVCQKKAVKDGETYTIKTDEELKIKATGHNFGAWNEEQPATCESSGTKAHKTCSGCHKNFDEAEQLIDDLNIPATGHTYGSEIAEKPATCVGTGTKAHYECSVCEKLFTKNGEGEDAVYTETTKSDLTIPAGHKFGDLNTAVSATCTTDGNVAYYHCSVCEKNFKEDKTTELDTVVIKATGHDYGDYVYNSESKQYEATCKNECSIKAIKAAGTEEYPYLINTAEDLSILSEASATNNIYVKLTDDITWNDDAVHKIYINRPAVIDLNSKTISCVSTNEDQNDFIYVGSNVKTEYSVTIKNGTLRIDGKNGASLIRIDNSATLTLEGITGSATEYGIAVFDQAKLTIKNSKITANYMAISNNNLKGGTGMSVTVEKSTLTSKDTAIFSSCYSTMTFTDCTIEGVYAAFLVRIGDIKIKGNTTLKSTYKTFNQRDTNTNGSNYITQTGTGEDGATFVVGANLYYDGKVNNNKLAIEIDDTVKFESASDVHVAIYNCNNASGSLTGKENVVDQFKIAKTAFAGKKFGNDTLTVKLFNYDTTNKQVNSVVAVVGDKYYTTLTEAIKAAESGATITLTDNITINSYISINKSLTIDFGGYTITSKNTVDFTDLTDDDFKQGNTGKINGHGFDIGETTGEGVTVTFKNGKLVTDKWGVWVENKAIFNVEKNFVISSSSLDKRLDSANAITIITGATLNLYGKAETTFGPTISGNGTEGWGDVTINIMEGAVITSGNDVAVYMPNTNTLNIMGGTITGTTAVYVKCGTTTISGGKLIATGDKKDYVIYNNGGNATGAALVIDVCCGYPGGDPTVVIGEECEFQVKTGEDVESADLISYYHNKGDETHKATITNNSNFDVVEYEYDTTTQKATKVTTSESENEDTTQGGTTEGGESQGGNESEANA